MSNINRQPVGILGFLGIKNFGRAPTQLAETVVPTWDLQKSYLTNAAEWGSASANIAANGIVQFGPLATTGGDAAYFHNVGVRVNASDPAMGLVVTLGLSRNSAANWVPLTRSVWAGDVVTQIPFPYLVARDFYTAPGEVLAYRVDDLAGGPIPVELTWRFTRLVA